MLEYRVFDVNVAGGRIAAQQVELFFVSRYLRYISDVQHGGNGGIGLKGPASPRKRRRLGSRRRSANLYDQNTPNRTSGGPKTCVKPSEKGRHPIVVRVAAVDDMD